MHLLGRGGTRAARVGTGPGLAGPGPRRPRGDAGGKTVIHVELSFTHEFTEEFGVDGNRVPLLRQVS